MEETSFQQKVFVNEVSPYLHEDITNEDNEIFPRELSDDAGQPPKEDVRMKKLSFYTVVFSIINSLIMGAIFQYPSAFYQLGAVLGIIIYASLGLLTHFSSATYQRAKNLSKHSGFSSIAETCFGKIGRTITSTTIAVNALGNCTVYLIIFLKLAENTLQELDPACDPNSSSIALYCKRPIIALISLLIIIPFQFGTFERLKIVSYIKTASVLMFTGIIVFSAFYLASQGTEAAKIHILPNIDEPMSILSAIAQPMVAYNFLTNQVSLYKMMDDSSDSKFEKATAQSISFGFIIYICVGLFGQTVYGHPDQGIMDSLRRRDLGDALYGVISFAFLISLLGGIPANYFSARNLICHAITRRMKKKKSNYMPLSEDQDIGQFKDEEETKQKFEENVIFYIVAITATTLIFSAAIWLPEGAKDILDLTGFLSGIMIIFIIPMAFYLALAWKQGKYRIGAGIIITVIVILGIIGFISKLNKIADK